MKIIIGVGKTVPTISGEEETTLLKRRRVASSQIRLVACGMVVEVLYPKWPFADFISLAASLNNLRS